MFCSGTNKKIQPDRFPGTYPFPYISESSLFEIVLQVPFAVAIKAAYPNFLLGSVELDTDAKQAETILRDGKVDIVFLARELLRRVDFPLIAAQELGIRVQPAHQYEQAWSRTLLPNH